MPQDVAGPVTVEITGKDLIGEPRQDVVDLNVQTAAFAAPQTPLLPEPASGDTNTIAIGAAILAGLLLLSATVAFRRTRQSA